VAVHKSMIVTWYQVVIGGVGCVVAGAGAGAVVFVVAVAEAL
jgi:hypothetical protein